MKNRILITLFTLFVFGFTANAQTLKIGYTNADYILSLLPEAKQLDSELKAYEQQNLFHWSRLYAWI